MFDVSGPSVPITATATYAASAKPVPADAPKRRAMGSIKSWEPEPKGTGRGSVSRSSSKEPAEEVGETGAIPEAKPPHVGQTVATGETTVVSADAQQAKSTGRARHLSERHVEDHRQSKRRTTDAEAEAPPPPPIEVPTLLTVGRTSIDLAASAAMAKDILAASEEQRPPPQPSTRNVRPTTAAHGSAASPSGVTGAHQSGGHTDEQSGPGVADDAAVTPSFFASTRGKKRFRRE